MVLGLIAFLVWAVTTRSLVAYLADSSPDVAYWLRATPTVLLNLADAKLNADGTTKAIEPVLSPDFERQVREQSYAKGIQAIEKLDPAGEAEGKSEKNDASALKNESSRDELSEADYKQVQTWAKQALRKDPLNARALRILGQLAERASTEARTAALMQAATERSKMESLAVFWMMRQNYRNGDYKGAVRYADILLRTRPQLARHVFPMLARIAENPSASGELKKVLAESPPWRKAFFAALPRNITDARSPLDLLLSLRETPNPSTDEERKSYLDALVQHGLYELAYYSWLQFLPPEQLTKAGRLFNGGFETTPSGLPFDWVFKKGAGVNVKFPQRSDQEGGQALLIEFGPGRVDFDTGITQLVLLPAGIYQLQGKYKADLVSQRGLKWSVTCAGAKRPVGESSTMNGSDSSWKDIDLDFTIPPDDCPAQYITLALDARSASEQFVSGAVWYDNLSLERVPDSAQQSEQIVPDSN